MAYDEQRHLMVEHQLKTRGIKDERVLYAMNQIPRHLFVEENLRDRAYDDCALPIGEGQTISQPYMVALMTELLELRGDETVLEIGTGSGYQSAVLSILAKEIFTVERIRVIALKAQRRLKELHYNNVHVIIGDGTLILSRGKLFDSIIVTAAAPKIPETFVELLSVNGRLVIPVGNKFSQLLYQVKKTPSGITTTSSTPCVFVPLIGRYGWRDDVKY
jgi:protein-L-isoaspartate(D-aspartate) O-methyltransferase